MATSKIQGNPIVVESGSIDGWNYRKWSDGTAECWKTVFYPAATFAAYGVVSVVEFLPTGILILPPMVNISGGISGRTASSIAYVKSDVATEGLYLNYYVLNNDARSITATYWAYIHVIGKWK